MIGLDFFDLEYEVEDSELIFYITGTAWYSVDCDYLIDDLELVVRFVEMKVPRCTNLQTLKFNESTFPEYLLESETFKDALLQKCYQHYTDLKEDGEA